MCEWESKDFFAGVLICFHVGIDSSLVGSEEVLGVHGFFFWGVLERAGSSFSGDFFFLKFMGFRVVGGAGFFFRETGFMRIELLVEGLLVLECLVVLV